MMPLSQRVIMKTDYDRVWKHAKFSLPPLQGPTDLTSAGINKTTTINIEAIGPEYLSLPNKMRRKCELIKKGKTWESWYFSEQELLNLPPIPSCLSIV